MPSDFLRLHVLLRPSLRRSGAELNQRPCNVLCTCLFLIRAPTHQHRLLSDTQIVLLNSTITTKLSALLELHLNMYVSRYGTWTERLPKPDPLIFHWKGRQRFGSRLNQFLRILAVRGYNHDSFR